VKFSAIFLNIKNITVEILFCDYYFYSLSAEPTEPSVCSSDSEDTGKPGVRNYINKFTKSTYVYVMTTCILTLLRGNFK
jgi:hypothetical protein